jgi:hypothetical protein
MAALALTAGNILTEIGLMEEPNCLPSEGEKEKGFNTEVTEGPQGERRVREGIFKAQIRKERRKEEACTGETAEICRGRGTATQSSPRAQRRGGRVES